MILYVNGDSHTAAAEAVNAHAFAMDDVKYFYLGRAPHPDNLAVSWARRLAETVKYTLNCDAESASSNARIIRTTKDWLAKKNSVDASLLIIQWSTWEREEWLIDGAYHQINASGIDDVPQSHQAKYKQYIIDIDWKQKTQQAHDAIWKLHLKLRKKNLPHVFFNGNNCFESIEKRKDWGINYIDPYSTAGTFNNVLLKAGFNTVAADNMHFDAEGHAFWSRFMLNYLMTHKLI